uniref:Tripartite motif-containing protein 16-like n=1 Tax=Scleropages formosus TaxID=113540 RepID=A0A8C9R3K8_SCLFO
MEQVGDSFNKDQFICPVCLDLLKDPVTIPCGHSYCTDCIEDCWDQEDHTFTSRPVLGRNTILAEVLEKLKKTELQAAPPEHCYAGHGDVACDVCPGRKNKAVKSCLVCLVSYCEPHLQPHYYSPAFKKHKLIDSTEQLQDRMCSLHDKLLEFYCSTDHQCVCYQCVMDEHKKHDTGSAAAVRMENQKLLDAAQREIQQRIKEREKDMEELRQAVDLLTRSAQAALEDTENIFAEMIHCIEKRCSEVKDVIRAQEKAALNQIYGLLEQVDQEIAELKKRQADLEKFSHTKDHIHFLQRVQSLCVSPPSGELPTINISLQCPFGDMKTSLSKLNNQLDLLFKGELVKISQTVREIRVTVPRTREHFLYYACELTLDPNTVNEYLFLSEGNTMVTWKEQSQSYPEHPERFNCWNQVLCREGLSGCCYWEVEWSGNEVRIAVSYKRIRRKANYIGCASGLGFNNQSWSFFCTPSRFSFYHNNKETAVSGPCSSRIGVYLDHRAGILSFYSISEDTMTLLHRVQTTFTEPLYPGFWVYRGSAVKLSCLHIIRKTR